MSTEVETTTISKDQTVSNSTENVTMTTEGNTSRSLPRWMYQNAIHSTIAFINVPFWGMMICFSLYCYLLWLAHATEQLWLQTILLLYLAYSVLDVTPARGGYGWWNQEWMEWLRSCWVCRLFCEYFPIRLIKTVDIPSNHSNQKKDDQKQSYMFLYHPHGVIGLGAIGALMTNGCNFTQQFPGLGRRRNVTLNVCFTCPFYREWMLLLGLVSANKATLKKVLQRGESVVLVPGGAAEALYAQPKRFRLYLRNRKGFIKLAMETGSPIVPVLGFGENNAFSVHVPKNESYLALMLDWLYRTMTFSLPILTSPSPQRHPIHVVVGEPVKFEDTKTSVDECHALYVEALTKLYDEHKEKYGHADIPLEIH